MELLILSHFQEASDFRNFASLVDQDLPVFFFFRETERIWFFEELVYIDHSRHKYFYLGSGIKVNGEEEGFWTYWYSNEEKETEGSFQNGKEEGFWIRWHKNGTKMLEGSYRNGKREGPWKEWYENRKKKSEGSYLNGEKEGPWTFWYENGAVHYEGYFRNGGVISYIFPKVKWNF